MINQLIRTFILGLVTVGLFMATGCGSVLSKGIVEQADRTVTMEMVQASPDLYKGVTVIWGGSIVKAENLEKTTVIEVLETELAYDDVPHDGDSGGRFLIEAQGYLDTTIYASSKRITVAGVVEGVRKQLIGKMEYPYPVVSPIEIKIFEERTVDYYEDYPPWWYGPYGPYYPSPYPYYPYPGYPYGPYPYRHYW